jgi:hypothetical protein
VEKTQTHAEKKIRLPVEIMDGMTGLAEENDRSVNGEILQACREWLRKHGRETKGEGGSSGRKSARRARG